MPRRHAPHHGGRPIALSPRLDLRCIGCPANVTRARLACPDCWNRLPVALRTALTTPEGASPHEMTGKVFVAAKANAARFLARRREAAE